VAQKYTIPNLANACKVLKFLGENDIGYMVSEIAKELSLPATSALRIVSTLVDEGLLRKECSRIYLGSVLIHLGSRATASTEIRVLAQPVLKSLTLSTGETAHLALPYDDRSLIVAVHDSPHQLRAALSPGMLSDLYFSSTGKVFLAFLHRHRIAEILDRHPSKKRTDKSLTTLTELEAAADESLLHGYGMDDEEFNPGVRCLAAPVRGPGGQVVAAIGITAATVRFTTERIPEMATKVITAANELSRLIGNHSVTS
jgi:DNA-binding IclR family transcriptional regulator